MLKILSWSTLFFHATKEAWLAVRAGQGNQIVSFYEIRRDSSHIVQKAFFGFWIFYVLGY